MVIKNNKHLLHWSVSYVSFDEAAAFRDEMRHYNTIAIKICSGLSWLQSVNDCH
jgi:hypothetical protein